MVICNYSVIDTCVCVWSSLLATVQSWTPRMYGGNFILPLLLAACVCARVCVVGNTTGKCRWAPVLWSSRKCAAEESPETCFQRAASLLRQPPNSNIPPSKRRLAPGATELQPPWSPLSNTGRKRSSGASRTAENVNMGMKTSARWRVLFGRRKDAAGLGVFFPPLALLFQVGAFSSPALSSPPHPHFPSTLVLFLPSLPLRVPFLSTNPSAFPCIHFTLYFSICISLFLLNILLSPA